MKTLALGSLSSVASATAVETGTSPFIQGESSVLIIYTPDGLFAGAAKLQSSDDGTTYADVSGATIADAGTTILNIASLAKYYQLVCSARTAGTVAAKLIG